MPSSPIQANPIIARALGPGNKEPSISISGTGAWPFKALGGHVVGEGDLIIVKRETEYKLWNRIVAEDRGEETNLVIERPEREAHAIVNEAALNDSP